MVMFQVGNKVLVANNMLGRFYAGEIDQHLQQRAGRALECNDGNIYSFASEENAKGFYRALNKLVCNCPDGFVPRNGFEPSRY